MGLPELMMFLLAFCVWIAPLAVAIWVVITLRRIRLDQQAIRARLDAIERQVRH